AGDGGGGDGGADGGADGGGDGGADGGGDGGAASLDGEWRGAIDVSFEVDGTSMGTCFTPLVVELVDNRFEGEWELRCEGPVASLGLGLGLDGRITGSGLAGEAHLVSDADTLSTALSGAVSTERIELAFVLRDGTGSSAVEATGEGELIR
ncbi:hypothetical protein L6R53_33240, partial [Myxococcota bacterium]|nr:hypothetical protein [Myxococcota bacterium]